MQIVAIDDDPLICHTLKMVLEEEYGDVLTLDHPSKLEFSELSTNPEVLLLDLNFAIGRSDGAEGLVWISRIIERYPEVSIIILTAHGALDLAVKAVKRGAFDFLEKPFINEKLVATVNAAQQLSASKQALRDSSSHNKQLLEHYHQPTDTVLGASSIMKKTWTMASKVAATDASVLITGDHGTGKEVMAKWIHHHSNRSSEPFIHVDLAALPASLFESSLFGYESGAFTDARQSKVGLIELANMGTLFLDEIGEIPLALQVKLLSVLQKQEVQPIGSRDSRAVDVRLIVASGRDLEALVNEGNFRADLLYRINTVAIDLPPLRSRLSDIGLFVHHFMDRYNRKYNKQTTIDSKQLALLESYDWPGNVRQLENSIERTIIMNDGQLLAEDITPTDRKSEKTDDLHAVEKQKIEEVIRRFEGNMTKAAKELGIGRNTLYRKIRKYGI
ncbi:MAG: sigma-54 dependent transcriptional regulator [Cyclobacteriaceae bacterium]